MKTHIQPYTGKVCPYWADQACNKCGWVKPAEPGLTKDEYDQLYPVGSQKRQEFERIHGPWCGHVRCSEQPECLDERDRRVRSSVVRPWQSPVQREH